MIALIKVFSYYFEIVPKDVIREQILEASNASYERSSASH